MSIREQKKSGRRNAQQQKIALREQQDQEYFWQCVRNEELRRYLYIFSKCAWTCHFKYYAI